MLTQIWIAISTYVLVAILKKRLAMKQSLYTILQVLSVMSLEKMPILQAFPEWPETHLKATSCNQLELFDL